MGWRENLLSMFQTGKSAFADIDVQALNLENHPDNIATFEAVTLYEACLKADQALRQEGIQGAVWVRNEQEPFLQDRMAALNAVRQKSGSFAFDGSTMRSVMGLSLQTDMRKGDDGLYRPRFDSYQGLKAEEVIDPKRIMELQDLTKLFGVSTLNIRYQMKEHIDPHYDYYTDSAPMDGDENRVFMGRPMRILASRHQPSTIVYDTHGEIAQPNRSGNITGADRNALKEAWQPAVGDYVFLCNYTWGMEKVLPHSPPEFACTNEQDARVLDVYDVKDGRRLDEIEPA